LKKKPSGARGAAKSSFIKLLDKAARAEAGEAAAPEETAGGEAAEATLQRLLDDIHSLGDALRERPFPEELSRYRQAVRGFLRFVVDRSFEVGREEGLPQYLRAGFKGQRGSEESRRRKQYVTIQVVDEKLEALAQGIMAGQGPRLELLGKLEEINGLLVDLME